MRGFSIIAMGLLALFLFYGCGRQKEPVNEYVVGPAPKVRVPESVLIGKGKYRHYCAPCHGLDGRGDGPNAQPLPIRPRNFTDIQSMKGKSDDHLMAAVRGGGASVGLSHLMPPWGKTLPEEEISNLIEYIKTLRANAR